MKSSEQNLLRLALKAYEKNELHEDDRETFGRDHRQFVKKELTFRELLESIRHPRGELKLAMEAHYTGTIYKRSFKGK
jgi:hypothetical protein